MNEREPFSAPGAHRQYPPHRELIPEHLEIDVELFIEERRAELCVIHHLRAKKPGVSTVAFDLIGADDVKVEGAELLDDDGERLLLSFASPFERDELRKVTLRYRIVDPIDGLLFSSPDEREPGAPRYAITDHETERARYWLATIDHPSVRPSLIIRLTSDEGDKLLANGALIQEEPLEGGRRRAIYRLDEGCPSYLTAFAVGEFVEFDDGDYRGIPVRAYAPPPFTLDDLKRTFGPTKRFLEFFERRFRSPYPFPKYTHFAARDIGGAMENISLVSFDDRLILDEALEREERRLVDIFNVHEMAHSWFGNHVVCRDFADAWLKEGFATYAESLYAEDAYGPDDRDLDLFAHANAYFEELDGEYQRAIITRHYQSPYELFDRHLYPGAALRLHLLRSILGDEDFFGGVSLYLERFGGKEAETDDLRRCFEERSGLSLARFFDQFFRSAGGYPTLKAGITLSPEALTLRVAQSPLDEKSDKENKEYFHFPLEVAIAFEESVVERTITMEGPVHELVVPLEGGRPPKMVRIDPRHHLFPRLEFNPGRRLLERQLEEAPDLLGRLEAAIGLVRFHGKAGIEAARRFAENEGQYLAIRAIFQALGKIGSQDALELLLELGAHEERAESLADLFRAIGSYRDERIPQLLIQRIERGLPPRAEGAAYEALGRQRDRAPLDVLERGVQSKAYGAFAASGALLGLGHSHQREALPMLIRALRERGSLDERARPNAAKALAILTPALERADLAASKDALEDALRDSKLAVRIAAVDALLSVDREHPKLDATISSLPLEERSRIERSRRAKPSGSPKETRLERLEERLRVLEMARPNR